MKNFRKSLKPLRSVSLAGLLRTCVSTTNFFYEPLTTKIQKKIFNSEILKKMRNFFFLQSILDSEAFEKKKGNLIFWKNFFLTEMRFWLFVICNFCCCCLFSFLKISFDCIFSLQYIKENSQKKSALNWTKIKPFPKKNSKFSEFKPSKYLVKRFSIRWEKRKILFFKNTFDLFLFPLHTSILITYSKIWVEWKHFLFEEIFKQHSTQSTHTDKPLSSFKQTSQNPLL